LHLSALTIAILDCVSLSCFLDFLLRSLPDIITN
jgi:hypothetical protein